MADEIILENVGYYIGTRPIIEDLSFSLASGQAILIAGASGSGKSVIMELCVGLRRPNQGRIALCGEVLQSLSYEALLQVRRRIGVVFQQHALIHNYPLFDNVALPLRYHSDLSEKEISIKVLGLLERLRLLDCSHKLPELLSVGQLKCAALARALVTNPRILFLDEPTGSLDPMTTEVLVSVLKEVQDQQKVAMVIISHNPFIIRQLSCSIRILDRGRLLHLDDFDKEASPPVPEIAAFIKGALRP